MNAAKRRQIKNIGLYIHNYSRLWDYLERRPMQLINLTLPALHLKMAGDKHTLSDCSESITAIFKWAGVKDPNGRGYDGTGNSETMLANLRNYKNPRFARIGAIVHFTNPDHVAFVIKPSPIIGDPLLWSHGQPGIALIKLSVERQFHNGPVTFLSVEKL